MGEWPPRYADARTLEGKLQRGLGTGFLEALEAPREAVHEILMRCIETDPRLDHQLDNRDWYYGELAIRTGLDVARLNEFLVDSASDEDETSYLAVCVLAQMARRGHTAADALLRDYVGWGPHWHSVLSDMDIAAAMSPAWTALAATVAKRALSQPAYLPLWGEPYESWAAGVPAIAELIEKPVPEPHQAGKQPMARPALSTEDLLASSLIGGASKTVAELARRRSKADVAAMEAALVSGSDSSRALACAALLAQANSAGLDVAIHLSSHRTRPPVARMVARRALLDHASAETLLPLGRGWRSSPNWPARHTALAILERHATVEDQPWVVRTLDRVSARDPRARFVVTSLADIIGARFSGIEFPVLGRRFDAFTYSFGRHYLAEALAVTDPTFPTTRAFTSLWDCEATTREVAAKHVSLDVPGAAERLREMAEGELEESGLVREGATARLS